MNGIARSILAVFLMALAATAHAGDRTTIEVPAAYAAIADEYGVPAGLLYSVGMAESRASFSGKPWPWTLNVRGRSLYFPTKAAAATHLADLLASGETMVDVGLMQVNWYWHGEKLRDPETALSPYYNLRVGAAYLREQYDLTGDWYAAAGRYHSKQAQRAGAYASTVMNHWERLLK